MKVLKFGYCEKLGTTSLSLTVNLFKEIWSFCMNPLRLCTFFEFKGALVNADYETSYVFCQIWKILAVISNDIYELIKTDTNND